MRRDGGSVFFFFAVGKGGGGLDGRLSLSPRTFLAFCEGDPCTSVFSIPSLICNSFNIRNEAEGRAGLIGAAGLARLRPLR